MSSGVDKNVDVSKCSACALLTLVEPDKCGELWFYQSNFFGWMKWKPSYGILVKDNLVLFKNKNSEKPKYSKPVSHFEQAKVNEPVDGESYCFSVRFEKGDTNSLILACDTDKTRISWIESINEAIKKVKKLSCDSAYISGGSLCDYNHGSTKQAVNGNENNYTEIDESEVLYTADTEKKATITDKHHTSMALHPVPNPLDSAYLNVGISSRSQSAGNEKPRGNICTMENLKLPVLESTSTPANNTDRINGGGVHAEGIYENTDKAFATYSNLDVRETKDCVKNKDQINGGTQRLTMSNTTGYGTVKKSAPPKIAPKPVRPRYTETTPVQPESEQQDSAFLYVGVNSSETDVKTPYTPNNGARNPTQIKQNLILELTKAVTNPDESDSNESSPIYENPTTFEPAFKAKKFKKEEYMCDSMQKGCLNVKPVGTFVVRRGKETNHELAIKTENGVSLFRIFEENGWVYLINNTKFPSIEELVKYYSYMTLPSSKFTLTLEWSFRSI